MALLQGYACRRCTDVRAAEVLRNRSTAALAANKYRMSVSAPNTCFSCVDTARTLVLFVLLDAPALLEAAGLCKVEDASRGVGECLSDLRAR